MRVRGLALAAVALAGVVAAPSPARATPRPRVRLATSMGDVVVELYPDVAPATVANFLAYVEAGFYDGTIVHRVVRNFILQAGGLTPALEEKRDGLRAPVPSEADHGVANATGTLAMARTSAPDSARAQFFVNLHDNWFLDHPAALDHVGYTVFGAVVDGMDVVRRIEQVRTSVRHGYPNVPVEPVVVRSATLLPATGISDTTTPSAGPP
jgi:peptidyl-prolyl cis-trans isomerase A (cyclophilin A)